MAILISFDIDGTLEVGDPPGELTMDMVRIAQSKGIIIGSCSDRIASSQRRIWDEHNIQADFICVKGSPMEELRLEYMKTKLPDYMIPTQTRFVKEFPLNGNGKIDRKKLKTYFTAH